MTTPAGDTPRDVLRASDADRERVAERLREAHGEGRLDLTELDERTAAAYAARTYGELAKVTEDLPPQTSLARRGGASPAQRRNAGPERADGGKGFQAAVGAWLMVSLINVVIWGFVSIGSGEFVYPWWIWVAGPWGAVLLASWIGTRVAKSS